MKKNMSVIMCMVCMMLLCACGEKQNIISKQETSILQEEKVIESKGNDLTVDAINPVLIEQYNLDKDVEITSGTCHFAIADDLETLSDVANEIVIGTVENVTYDAIEGNPWTKIDISIAETLKGDLSTGDSISIYMLGGYISLEEHIKYYDDAKRFDLSENQIKKTVLKSIVENEEFPIVGEKSLFYLSKTTSETPLPNEAYERVCGKYAELEFVDEETFKRQAPNENGEKQEIFSRKQIKEKIKNTTHNNARKNKDNVFSLKRIMCHNEI